MRRVARKARKRAPRRLPRARPVAIAALLGVAAVNGPAQADGRIAARIGAETIGCESLRAQGPAACATALLRAIVRRVEQRVVERYGLHATESEVDALEGYLEAFERHDREQRTRKLAELEARLARMPADEDGAERSRLLEFRAILRRLAAYDADRDRGVEVRAKPAPATLVAWVEEVKLDRALHRHYGGTVGIKPGRAYAHSARAAVVAEFMLRETVTLPDAEVARHFVAALWAPPAIAYHGEAPDFTPFWTRPLVPSYVAPH